MGVRTLTASFSGALFSGGLHIVVNANFRDAPASGRCSTCTYEIPRSRPSDIRRQVRDPPYHGVHGAGSPLSGTRNLRASGGEMFLFSACESCRGRISGVLLSRETAGPNTTVETALRDSR